MNEVTSSCHGGIYVAKKRKIYKDGCLSLPLLLFHHRVLLTVFIFIRLVGNCSWQEVKAENDSGGKVRGVLKVQSASTIVSPLEFLLQITS